MPNEFERIKNLIINKVLACFPQPVRVIIVILVLAGGAVLAWKGILSKREPPNQMMDVENRDFLAQQMWTETQSNLKTLDRFWVEKDKFAFRKKSAHFIYDSYSRYAGQLGAETSQQVDNFYKNLKRIENGESYTNDEIAKVKGQGVDVLNFLKRDFGLHDYFENNPGIRIASAYGTSVLKPTTNSGIVSVDTAVVSADLPALTKPPYGSVGDDIPKGKNDESD